ncbi:MAG: hypothetical protein HDQ98_14510 [Lachnospiraceae bacterium]|nr:hypothetical protein [Lachnospiraceae bacterium]MBD5533385.1 hypothetical protein [Lachnospiraceae bacterium]
MYLIIVMAVYFTIRDVQLIREAFRNMKRKRKLPELQQPKEPDKGEDNRTDVV